MRFHFERHLGALLKARARKNLTKATSAVVTPPEFNPHDYISYLLYIDAEIEHGLMVQYLFSAYSLGGPQVPPEFRERVACWQETVLGIAKEEMAHLISVQNVLRLIGAPLNLGREDYPWDSPFYPFPFSLEPLTLDVLARYVYAESPEDWSGPLKDEIYAIVEAYTPSPHRVGELFKLVIELLSDPNFLGDEAFQAQTWPFQAKFEEWGRGYAGGARGGHAHGACYEGTPDLLVVPVSCRDDAVSALQQIAEQGEATSSASEDAPSHFARFLDIYKEMKVICQGWSPVRPVGPNPFLGVDSGYDAAQGQETFQNRSRITDPESVLWSHLFNVRYRMVLTYLNHSFNLDGGLNQAGAWTPRGTIINATFGEMYHMRAISNILMQSPLDQRPVSEICAGPPFQMPYTLNLPFGERNRWQLHKDLLEASADLIGQLLATTSADRQKFLYALLETDGNLMQLINRILAGYTELALT